MPIIYENQYVFTSSNRETPIHVLEWIPEGQIKGIIQISHGVAEYIDRYADFARFLASNGFAAVGNDHLGHGKSIQGEEDLGYFGKHGGWDTVVDDMEKLRLISSKKWPDVPYFLFGHSMGSFLTRTHLIRYPDSPLSGAILSGTGYTPTATLLGGKAASILFSLLRGPRNKNKMINDMAFGTYSKGLDPRRTDFDWLSTDEKLVDAYVADPLCGFVPSVGLFRDMMGGLAYIQKNSNLAKMNKDLPVYFMSGRNDPVGGNGTGVDRVYRMFLDAGMKDVFYRIYENGRHEMLNEKNKEDVFSDVLNWVQSKTEKIK